MKQFWLSLVMALSVSVEGFVPTTKVLPAPIMPTTSSLFAENGASDEEIVGRRIIVKGDVNGGYYRSCVLNEVSQLVIVLCALGSLLGLSMIIGFLHVLLKHFRQGDFEDLSEQ